MKMTIRHNDCMNIDGPQVMNVGKVIQSLPVLL